MNHDQHCQCRYYKKDNEKSTRRNEAIENNYYLRVSQMVHSSPVADMTCSGFYRDRRTGLTLAGKRIRKGCEVHRSGDYLNEVKMLQLCKSPYVVTLHGCSAQFGGPKGEAFNRVQAISR